LFREFSSKYDFYLEGKVQLSAIEQEGLELFQGKARCNHCHSMQPDTETGKVLFTDYGYHNLGVPRNEQNPFYLTHTAINPLGTKAVDTGLGQTLGGDPRENGKFRVPTLRNVQYTGPYFHNGYFKTLKEVVHFINSRDSENLTWPEVYENIAHQITGSLHLTDHEEDAIVAFMLCLTDGYSPN
jgi:cytochrome c peroxidase